MSARVFLVGTDTTVGKTTVACALLHSARRAGVRAVPFKPTMTGRLGPKSDLGRLLAASGIDREQRDDVAPLRYQRPLAPGIADDPNPFLGRGTPTSDPASMLGRARWAIARLEQRNEARVSIIEGVGGLLVPMPGGTWQDHWIAGLGAAPIVVARAGLGTINHTLLTIDALRTRDLEPLGFFLSQLREFKDTSRDLNAEVIAHRSELPCLGYLPFLGKPQTLPENDDWHLPDLWPRLLGTDP
jgi:dethiobiotin synthetase